jgi:hypothetical protein
VGSLAGACFSVGKVFDFVRNNSRKHEARHEIAIDYERNKIVLLEG